MNLSKLSFSQLVNFALATFLLVGIAATSYTVSGLRNYAADAAKGGKSGGSSASISLDQANPRLGDTVTFTTSGEKHNTRIALACYQGGLHIVYSADQSVGTSFLLGGSMSEWLTTGGDVFCYAWLYNNNLSKGFLASTNFTASGI